MGKNLYTDARECVIKNGFFTEILNIGPAC